MQAVETRFEQLAKREGRNVEDCKRLVIMQRMRAFTTRKGMRLKEDQIREAFKKSMSKTSVSLFNITASMIDEEDEDSPVLIDIEAPSPGPTAQAATATAENSETDEDGFVKLQKLPVLSEKATPVDLPTTVHINQEQPAVEPIGSVESSERKLLTGILGSKGSDSIVPAASSADQLLDSILKSFSGESLSVAKNNQTTKEATDP